MQAKDFITCMNMLVVLYALFRVAHGVPTGLFLRLFPLWASLMYMMDNTPPTLASPAIQWFQAVAILGGTFAIWMIAVDRVMKKPTPVKGR